MSTATYDVPQLFETINTVARPLIRLGVGNPWLLTPGATVLEVEGRKTGELRSVPLTCFLGGPVLVVGTVRANSQWIRNLEAARVCHVWLWGRRWPMTVAFINENVAALQFETVG